MTKLFFFPKVNFADKIFGFDFQYDNFIQNDDDFDLLEWLVFFYKI